MKRQLFTSASVIALILAYVSLAGCATRPPPEPIVQAVPVSVPTPIDCSPQVSPHPNYPDSDQALKDAPDIFTAVQLLLAGRLLRGPYEAELEAALSGCKLKP